MKTLGALALISGLVLAVMLSAFAGSTAVDLGTAASFAVLAGSGISNTGTTTINGDVGLDPAGASSVTGFNTVTLNGTLYTADAVALEAKNDLLTAYNTAANATPVTTIATELGGTVLNAGVYNSSSGTFGLTGVVTLNGQNNANSIFIFQAASTLITASGSSVVLENGASACNVYFQVGSSATLGTTTSFEGNILADTSITLDTGATLLGRALANNGAVTMDTNVITTPSCPTASPSPSVSPSPSPSVSPSPSPSVSPSPSPSPSVSPSASPLASGSGGAGTSGGSGSGTATTAALQLPFTGFDALALVEAALGLILAGGLLVLRRSRSRTATPGRRQPPGGSDGG